MPKCRKCGNKLPRYIRGWEFICPRCGVHHPSIRALTGELAVWVILLAVYSLLFLDRTTLIARLVLAALVCSVVLKSVQLIVLYKRRKGSSSSQFLAD